MGYLLFQIRDKMREANSLFTFILQVADTAVHAYVLGEHGDSQMVCHIPLCSTTSVKFYLLQAAWSTATVGGSPIQNFLPPTCPSLYDLANSAKTKAYSIIAAKGATAYGIASVVSSICESILLNQRHVRPVSHWIESMQAYISLPAVLGHGGVQKTVKVPLDETEKELLRKSVEEIKSNIRAVEEGKWYQ
jgi:L-lactate dehydrogenase